MVEVGVGTTLEELVGVGDPAGARPSRWERGGARAPARTIAARPADADMAVSDMRRTLVETHTRYVGQRTWQAWSVASRGGSTYFRPTKPDRIRFT